MCLAYQSGTASSKGGLNSINKIDDLLVDPSKLAGVSGDELYEYLIKNGYDVKIGRASCRERV